jgi:acetyl esterase
MTLPTSPVIDDEVKELLAQNVGARSWQQALERAIAHPDEQAAALAEARTLVREESADLPAPAVAEVLDHVIDLPDRALAVRLFRPIIPAPSAWILYAHGGGWMAGDLDTHAGLACALSLHAGACVLAVDYRLAPEYSHPAPLEDVLAAAEWARAHAAELGLGAEQWAVAGDSAGATLVASACVHWRELGLPAPRAQVLLYPALDPTAESESMKTLGQTFPPTQTMMRWLWRAYVADGAAGSAWPATPVAHESLRDLPPALVVTAGLDPLRDEGAQFAKALRAAGVPATLDAVDGVPHGFLRLPLRLAQNTLESIGDFTSAALETTPVTARSAEPDRPAAATSTTRS